MTLSCQQSAESPCVLTRYQSTSLGFAVLWGDTDQMLRVFFTLESEVSLLETGSICHHEYYLTAAVPKGTLDSHL